MSDPKWPPDEELPDAPKEIGDEDLEDEVTFTCDIELEEELSEDDEEERTNVHQLLWELLEPDDDGWEGPIFYRAKVKGGWLLANDANKTDTYMIEDPDHFWTPGEED